MVLLCTKRFVQFYDYRQLPLQNKRILQAVGELRGCYPNETTIKQIKIIRSVVQHPGDPRSPLDVEKYFQNDSIRKTKILSPIESEALTSPTLNKIGIILQRDSAIKYHEKKIHITLE